MASILYPSFKEGLLNKEFDMNTDTLKAFLATDAQNSADTVLSDKTMVGSAVTLTTPTIAAGVFDADDVTFTAVPVGSTALTLEIYDDTHATDKLVCSIDITDTVTNDGNITITFDSGANKIFAL